MDTPIATPDDENLPGVPFFDRRKPGSVEQRTQHPSGESFDSGTFSGEFGNLGNWTIRWVETTGSTNTDLIGAATRGGSHGLVLVADHQTAGRGRLDRMWEAPHGVNLLVSILFRDLPEIPHQLTQAVAVAAAEACEEVARQRGRHLQVDVKWPNDVLIGGRKLAGILASAGSGDAGFVVVGLGLNIGWAPAGAVSLAQAMAESGGTETSDTETSGLRDEVLIEILRRLSGLLEAAGETQEKYLRRLSTLGREVRVELPSGDVLEGRAIGVEADGRLVVLDACAVTHRLDVGDIVHLR